MNACMQVRAVFVPSSSLEASGTILLHSCSNTQSHLLIFLPTQVIQRRTSTAQLFHPLIDLGLLVFHLLRDDRIVAMQTLVHVNGIIHHVSRPQQGQPRRHHILGRIADRAAVDETVQILQQWEHHVTVQERGDRRCKVPLLNACGCFRHGQGLVAAFACCWRCCWCGRCSSS